MVRNSKDVIKLSKKAKRQKMSFSPGQQKMLCFGEKIETSLTFSHELLSGEEIWESQFTALCAQPQPEKPKNFGCHQGVTKPRQRMSFCCYIKHWCTKSSGLSNSRNRVKRRYREGQLK